MSVAQLPRGLVNLGNTCYFNSIMQALLNAPLFGPILEERTSTTDNKYFLESPDSKKRIEVELPECDYAVKALVDLYKQYTNKPQKRTTGNSNNSTSNLQPISPNKLMSSIRQKTGRFQRLVQEDSHELLRSLIDIIRSDEIHRQKAAIAACQGDNKSDIKHEIYTLIDMIFGGFFLSSVKCQKCKYQSQHLEPFYDLSLAITDPTSDIRAALANFTSNAILDGENKFICDRCSKTNGKKTYEAGVKSTNIAVPPNILTLHLKRFEASGDLRSSLGGGRKGGKAKGGGGGRRTRGKAGGKDDVTDDDGDMFSSGVNLRKINKHVEFTEFLDLSDFTSDLCYDLTKINNWPRINKDDPIWYSLFGVVCHSGNLRGGHYTAYVKIEDPVDDNYFMEEFAEFIQKTPYVPEPLDIDKIRECIRRHDSTRCETTDKYRDDEQTFSFLHQNGNSSAYNDDYDKPKSIPGHWYHISDSQVRKSNIANVLASQAYILFYRRVIE